MKIMVYNTQHCASYVTERIDFELIAEVIKQYDPDVVGLNEMRDKGNSEEYTAQTDMLSKLTGLENKYFARAILVSGTEPYGNALLSKYPIVSAVTVPVPDPEPKKYNGYYETRCLLKARLECGLTVLVIHFGLNPDEQESAVRTVLENLEDEKCILMGDFNLEPDSPILAPIRARMRDAAELFESEKKSWPSDEPRVKIDYIFATPDVEILNADIPAIVASDHRPHTAEIKL
jgi:endonuclease/exonuclease/phosphatase family metal-dependent hydrolase